MFGVCRCLWCDLGYDGEEGRPERFAVCGFFIRPRGRSAHRSQEKLAGGLVGCGECRSVGQPGRFDRRDVEEVLSKRPTTEPTSLPHLICLIRPPAVRPSVHPGLVAQYLRSVALGVVDARFAALLGATKNARRMGSVLC